MITQPAALNQQMSTVPCDQAIRVSLRSTCDSMRAGRASPEECAGVAILACLREDAVPRRLEPDCKQKLWHSETSAGAPSRHSDSLSTDFACTLIYIRSVWPHLPLVHRSSMSPIEMQPTSYVNRVHTPVTKWVSMTTQAR